MYVLFGGIVRLPSNLIDSLRGKNLLRLPRQKPKLVLARDLETSGIDELTIFTFIRFESDIVVVEFKGQNSGELLLDAFDKKELINLAELYDAVDAFLAQHESVLPTPPVK